LILKNNNISNNENIDNKEIDEDIDIKSTIIKSNSYKRPKKSIINKNHNDY
jgi:hypothetical protein